VVNGSPGREGCELHDGPGDDDSRRNTCDLVNRGKDISDLSCDRAPLIKIQLVKFKAFAKVEAG
jgi:hypothetical protein